MSDHEARALERKRQERVRETKIIRGEQARRAREHYSYVKRKEQSPWYTSKHNRKDGS